jgi:hypothetical protein
VQSFKLHGSDSPPFLQRRLHISVCGGDRLKRGFNHAIDELSACTPERPNVQTVAPWNLHADYGSRQLALRLRENVVHVDIISEHACN